MLRTKWAVIGTENRTPVISTGCVPPASVSVLGLGGGCLPRGCLPGGVSAWVCLFGGLCPRGCLPRGKCLPNGCTPHPVNRMTDRCKNITLPQTSFAGGKNITENWRIIVNIGNKTKNFCF